MKEYSLKITSAIAVGGEIVRAGRVLHNVPEQDARRLIERGKAELATDVDVAADEKPKGKAKAAAAADKGEGK